MTYQPCRRGVSKGVAGARTRQKADLHEGTVKDFLRRHEMEATIAVRENAAARNLLVAKLFSRTVDSRNLRLAWDCLAAGDGQAPGIDGLRFDDLDDHEAWNLVRSLSEAIQADTYRTNKDLKLQIPKASGKGTRPLSIPTIIDRMVQRAIVQMIQPILDPFFSDCSMGFRPHRSVYTALALAEEYIVTHNRWVLLTEDLKDAFNHIPQQRLLDVVRMHLPNKKMMQLIKRVTLTETGKGLRQGGNLSPLLLNVYLDHFLDKKWERRHPDVVLIRWADDLLLLCGTREEALQAYKDLETLLQPTGMRLKSTPDQAIRDLRMGEEVEWLSFRLIKGKDGLEAHLKGKAWKNLAEHLEECHVKDNSPQRAIETINCWVGSMGACFSHTDVSKAYARISSLASNLAFDEIPSLEDVSRTWLHAYHMWSRTRRVGKRALV